MSKAILVIDMPDKCSECTVCHTDTNGDIICQENKLTSLDTKPDWCPLKAVPKRNKDEFRIEWACGYKAGWNECLDAIVGKEKK